MSTVGFTALAFCHMPFGMVGALGFMASISIREATKGATGDGGGSVLASCHLEVEAAALESATDLFLDRTPNLVRTILRLTKREKQRNNGGFNLRGKEEKRK